MGARPKGREDRISSGLTVRLAKVIPGLVAGAFAIPLLAVAQHFGYVADVPVAIIACGVVGGAFGASGATLVWPPGGSDRAMLARVAVCFATVATMLYMTGWGAVLAVGYVFGAIEEFRVSGSKVATRAIPLVVVYTIVGESLIAAGWVPTLVPEPEGHGLAVLTGLGACLIIGFLGITQREKEKSEESLRQSETRMQALVRHASDAIVVVHPDGSVIYASPAIERMLGYRSEEFTHFDLKLLREEQHERASLVFEHVMQRPRDFSWVEFEIRHANGEYRWFEIGVTNLLDDPAVGGLVCNMRDVTERKAAQDQLQFEAHHDALTLLPNRWYFLERLERAQIAAAQSEEHVAVLFLDIDRFKVVNDSLGHDVGDQMLVAVAERLNTFLRPGDVVARFGGDEFTVLLTGVSDPELARRVAARIAESLREPLLVGGRELFATVSVGIAISHAGADPASDLLRHADLAMYVAKEKGRARWEEFDPSFTPRVMEHLELEGDLRRALDHGELVVHFQPEVSLLTGRVRAAEALVRWNHPRRGLLEPDRFIPFAEESSLIVAIDRYVLQEACRWANRWSTLRSRTDALVVSVNLSPRFMHQADLVADVKRVLRETGVDPRAIQIEVTERSAITDLETTCAQLHELRAIGVQVAVDDFGTGYSSLSYLKELPIDVLKLDKSFVDGLDSGAADVAIVQAIVTMGHALGVKVTAEGVERPEQAARLRELHCDAAMGWLWSRAVPAEQLAAVVESGFAESVVDPVVVPFRARA